MTVEVGTGRNNTWLFRFYFRLPPKRLKSFSVACEVTYSIKNLKRLQIYETLLSTSSTSNALEISSGIYAFILKL